MRSFLLVILGLLLSWAVLPIAAQVEHTCPVVVQTAVDLTSAACQSVGRNQLCYGSAQLEVTPQENVPELVFNQTGDLANVVDVHALRLGALDAISGIWGVAVMKIQANLPETLPGQNVTFVLFGDVEVEAVGAGTPVHPVTLPVTTKGKVNTRVGPSTNQEIYAALDGTVAVDGRLEDGSWLRFRASDTGDYVWIAAAVVTPQGDLSTLPVVDPASAVGAAYGPMQAFYFRSGIGDSQCAEAPNSGLLIQTPKGAGQVTLSINGIDFTLGSTAALYTIPAENGNDSFAVSLFDGQASLADVNIYAGQTQNFALQSGQYVPVGPPQDFDPNTFGSFQSSVLQLLPERIDIPQRGVLNSGDWDVVYNYYAPSPGVTPNGCAAVLLHNAGLDNTTWTGWLIPALRDSGWGVLAPDMPAHGQTGGENDSRSWNAWAPIALDTAAYLQSQYGYSCGVFAGSSIGANVSAYACAQLPEWCVGAALLSPGFAYMGSKYPTLDKIMPELGQTPVYLAAGERDRAGADSTVAHELATAGNNVTVQVYDTDLHGTLMAGEFPLWQDMATWWSNLLVGGN